MKKTRAKKPAMPKAVHARPKRRASRPDALPDVAPVEQPTNKEPPAPALEAVGNKARRRLDRPSRQALCWRRRRERTTDPEPCRSFGIGLDR